MEYKNLEHASPTNHFREYIANYETKNGFGILKMYASSMKQVVDYLRKTIDIKIKPYENYKLEIFETENLKKEWGIIKEEYYTKSNKKSKRIIKIKLKSNNQKI